MKALLDELEWRGLLCQKTPNVEELQNSAAYIGFDLTADSLHVGSLVQIMILRMLKKHNIPYIILLGEATTQIGDPTGKDKSREILSDFQIQENKRKIQKVFEQFGLSNFETNQNWFRGLGYLKILSEIGPYISVNKMLSLDSIKNRLEREQKLSFLEFNYSVLQAYDFVQLAKNKNCLIQIGGSDQWGNIVVGIELGKKMLPSKSLYAITTPLIMTADGKKMGKTEKGAVWLSAEKTSAQEYFHFWRNVKDEDVFRFLKMFTDLSKEQIEKLEKKNINNAKEVLAFEATRICHGENEALLALENEKQTSNKNVDFFPKIVCRNNRLFEIVLKANMAKTNSEARRLIIGGAVKINGNTTKNPEEIFSGDSAVMTISKKNNFLLISE